MFKFFKDKLKGALKKFSDEVEDEAEIEELETISKEKVAEKKPIKEEKTSSEVISKEVEEKEETVEEKSVEDLTKKEVIKETIEEKPVKKTGKKEIITKDSKDIIEEETTKEVVKEETKLPDIESIKEEIIKKEEEPVKEAEEKEISEDEHSKEKIDTDKIYEDEPDEKKGFFTKIFRKSKEEDEVLKDEPAKKEELEDKKESFFTKIRKVSLSESKFNDLFWELEIVLLENNVAVEVIEKIKDNLREALTGEKIMKKSMGEVISETLHDTIKEILSVEQIDLLKEAKKKKENGEPLVIAMIGVNGSGKTTTLAKLAKYFQDNDLSIVVAAADTFRAAAIQQLEEHTNNLGIKLIKHNYNADPAAVAYDAVKHARSKNIDVVLIDSAGRLHSNDNLMNELKKLIRINKPDIKIFVGEATTGNDCVQQAKLFNEAVGINAIILAKADVDEKGGAAVSASFITKRPVIFLGVGQNYEDLQKFNPETILRNLGL